MMNNETSILVLVLLSYLMGAIPTGVWVSKIFFGYDIRTKGSGNMGSTNIFRVLGAKWGVIVQVIDLLKGVIPVLVFANILFPEMVADKEFFEVNKVYLQATAGVSAVIGHIFPVFVKFKGGKGINTAAGMLMGLAPIEIGFGVAVFLLVLFSSGYISLSSLSTAVSLPIIICVRYFLLNSEIQSFNFLLTFFMVLLTLVLITHKSNIKRLIKGEENKFEKLHLIKFKK